MKRTTPYCLVALWLVPLAALPAADAPRTQQPNIALILADDLGYGDVGCYGATKIQTPSVDRLAADGVRFTDAHSVAAVCNPTRYSILSGTYLWHAKRKNDYSLYFHEGQVTLPSLLQSDGYRTAALGKWHNGFGRNGDPDWNGELKPGPLEIGFDYFFGTPRTHNEPPFVFVENHQHRRSRPGRPDPHHSPRRGAEPWPQGLGVGHQRGRRAAHAARPDEQLDLILAEKAVAFLAQQTTDVPFFLYLAFAAPHGRSTRRRSFAARARSGFTVTTSSSSIIALDLVLDALDKYGFAPNTLVIFTSDNGAVLTRDALAARPSQQRSVARPENRCLGRRSPRAVDRPLAGTHSARQRTPGPVHAGRSDGNARRGCWCDTARRCFARWR